MSGVFRLARRTGKVNCEKGSVGQSKGNHNVSQPASNPRARSHIDVFREFPETAQAIGALHETIMRRESAFTLGERELMAALVSALNGCNFCSGVHRAAAEAFGIEPALLEAIVADIDTASIPAPMKPVLHFVARLTLEPSRTGRADTDAMRAAGWDDKAIFAVVCVCSFYNFMNRYVDGTGLSAAPEQLRVMGQQLARASNSR
jgi:uncharacterized peroxidase-related enzyme